MDLIAKTQPETLPVPLAEAKLHLRVNHDDEDDLIEGLIKASSEVCENIMRRSVLIREHEAVLNRFPKTILKIPMPPLITVVWLKYINTKGEEITLVEGTDYMAVPELDPGIIYPIYDWPGDTLNTPDAVRLRVETGMIVPPEPVKQAVLLLVGHYYENREAVDTGTGRPYEMPLGVKLLLSPYQLPWW